MIARGHQVEIACPREARIFAEAPRFGVPATALPIGRKRPRGVVALRRFLAARQVDAINAHSSTDAWLAALAGRSLSRPPPLVRTRHISAPVPRDALTRWLYTKATAEIVTTGEAIRTQLIRDIGVAPSRVSSIPTGIDPERFGPARPRRRAALARAAGRRAVGRHRRDLAQLERAPHPGRGDDFARASRRAAGDRRRRPAARRASSADRRARA